MDKFNDISVPQLYGIDRDLVPLLGDVIVGSYSIRDILNTNLEDLGYDDVLIDSINMREQSNYNELLSIIVRDYIGTLEDASIDDLIYPWIIPNKFGSKFKSRISNIINTCSNDTSIISPYEFLFTTNIIGDISGHSKIYLNNYGTKIDANTIPIIMKITDFNFVLNDETYHEYLVGVTVNLLRNNIANLVYTYGHSQVSNPIFINDVGYYGSNGEGSQLYLEFIDNAISLNNIDKNYIGTLSINNNINVVSGGVLLRSILLQIICALYYANIMYGYIHGDLNMNNILLVTLDDNYNIPIMVPKLVDGEIEFNIEYILSNILVVIIDNGTSIIRNVLNIGTASYLIPEFSIYDRWINVGLENDLVLLMNRLYNVAIDTNIYSYDNIGQYMHRFINILNTNNVPQYNNILFEQYNNIINNDYIGSNYRVHPQLQYYIDDAVIQFCLDNKSLLHEYNNQYPYILDDNYTENIGNDTIVDPRQYKWYNNNTPVDLDLVEDNIWFKYWFIDNILPDNSNIDELSNTELQILVRQYIGEYSNLMLDKLKRYVEYFRPLNLDISPFKF